MAGFLQLLGISYDRLGELLHYTGIQTAQYTVPQVKGWSGEEVAFRAAWITSVIITGAVVDTPIVIIARRLRHVAASRESHFVSNRHKKERARHQVVLVGKHYGVTDKMIVELQAMVSFALTLMDQLSNTQEAATQFQLICRNNYETFRTRFRERRDLYLQVGSTLRQQLMYPEGKYEKLEQWVT